MSLSLIIGGAIALVIVVLILVSTSKSKKKKKIKFLDPLNELARSVDCHISHYDIWSESVIGIDENKNHVFAIRKTVGNEAETIINLAEIFRSRVAEISRSSGMKEVSTKIFDHIDLVFMNKEKSRPDIIVEFYNSNTDRLTLAGELQLAEKWCALVNRRIAAIGK